MSPEPSSFHRPSIAARVALGLCVFASSGCYWGGGPEDVEPIVPRTSSKPPRVPLGLNLGSLNYYAPSVPFVDGMKTADDPQTTDANGDGEWNTELMEQLPRDAAGYPLEVPYAGPAIASPQWVRYAVLRLVYGGSYTLLYDGDGDFEFPTVPVEISRRSPGMLQLEIPERDAPLFLTITRSRKDNHVRNLRLLLPGFEPSATAAYHPRFLERIQGASVLRFMDWQRTNDSKLARFDDRALPERTQASWRGASFETMIDLANQAGADPWFCVPHLADDDFVQRMATLLRDRLAPGRVLYVEYSNELWNGIFSQYEYVAQRGCSEGLQEGSCNDDAERMWAGTRWTARRAAQVFAIFERVFGGSERLVRVLGGQAANVTRNEVLLEAFNDPAINPNTPRADALAIAPYFGHVVNALAEDQPPSSVTVDLILKRTGESIATQVRDATRSNKRLADKFGLRLVAYEGGQHLVATGSLADDEALTEKLIAANRDPRMAALYRQMFDAWYKESGRELMVLFNSAELPGKHGSWGLLESQEQPMERAPKYRAYREQLAELSQNR